MVVSVVMGSKSDETTMRECCLVLQQFNIPYEYLVISAHRTPEKMVKYAKEARDRGIKIIIAGAGGAAHLPGMIASLTTLPVIGVPIQSKALQGMDSLLSIVQMPYGVAVGTMAIGSAGAKNAGLYAVQMLSLENEALTKQLSDFKVSQQKLVAAMVVEDV